MACLLSPRQRLANCSARCGRHFVDAKITFDKLVKLGHGLVKVVMFLWWKQCIPSCTTSTGSCLHTTCESHNFHTVYVASNKTKHFLSLVDKQTERNSSANFSKTALVRSCKACKTTGFMHFSSQMSTAKDNLPHAVGPQMCRTFFECGHASNLSMAFLLMRGISLFNTFLVKCGESTFNPMTPLKSYLCLNFNLCVSDLHNYWV